MKRNDSEKQAEWNVLLAKQAELDPKVRAVRVVRVERERGGVYRVYTSVRECVYTRLYTVYTQFIHSAEFIHTHIGYTLPSVLPSSLQTLVAEFGKAQLVAEGQIKRGIDASVWKAVVGNNLRGKPPRSTTNYTQAFKAMQEDPRLAFKGGEEKGAEVCVCVCVVWGSVVVRY